MLLLTCSGSSFGNLCRHWAMIEEHVGKKDPADGAAVTGPENHNPMAKRAAESMPGRRGGRSTWNKRGGFEERDEGDRGAKLRLLIDRRQQRPEPVGTVSKEGKVGIQERGASPRWAPSSALWPTVHLSPGAARWFI